VVTGFKPNNGDSVKNTNLEATRHFRNRRKENLKDRINELAVCRGTLETCMQTNSVAFSLQANYTD
jgi:hypothetical protein